MEQGNFDATRPGTGGQDSRWSSTGLRPKEAISQWCQWASRTLAPIDVRIGERDNFTAQWRSHGLGPLRFVQMGASAQHVVHPAQVFTSSHGEPTFQLVYSRHGTFTTRTVRERFKVRPGEFVLLDNSRFYQMDMDGYHEAIDLVMPQAWLERWLPDPQFALDRPISACEGWGAPLGSLLDTMANGLESAALPDNLMADQVGSLLSLLTGFQGPAANSHRTRLTQRILRLIEENYANSDMTVEMAARDLGISKRYVHTLLAERGTSFVQALNSGRLERAADMLKDRRLAEVQVSELAWRCGFTDAGYFARLFRRRFDMSPRDWRARHLAD